MSGRAKRGTAKARRPPQRGDETELFERYGEQLVRIVQGVMGVPRHLAEDACSFAWLQLLRCQPGRDSLFAWLRVVATREALRLLKGQARLAAFDEDAVEPPPALVDGGASLELAIDAHEALEQLTALSPQQTRIFSLHVAGLSYEEICEVTGYSWTQVNRHMVRSRAKLRARRRGSDA
jgi:RNA polymerase sigma factor (sigma-70 family)